jgi:hypothetical protein
VLCCHLINPINIGRQPVHDMSDAQVVGLEGWAAKSRDEHRPFVRRTILIVGWGFQRPGRNKVLFYAESCRCKYNEARQATPYLPWFRGNVEAITSSSRKTTPALTGREYHGGECPSDGLCFFHLPVPPFPPFSFLLFFFANKTKTRRVSSDAPSPDGLPSQGWKKFRLKRPLIV